MTDVSGMYAEGKWAFMGEFGKDPNKPGGL